MKSLKNLLTSVRQKGLFHLFTANVFLQIAGFASQFFVTGILDPTDIGRIKILQSIMQVISVLFGLGLNSSVLKLCSENNDELDKIEIYKAGFTITLLSSIVGYLLMLYFAKEGVLSSDVGVNNLFVIYGLLLIPITINVYQSSYLQAIKQIKQISKIQVTTKTITIVGVIAGTYYFGVVGFCVMTLLGFLMTSGVFIRATKISLYNLKLENIKVQLQHHFHYAFFGFWANILAQIGMVLDVFFLNIFIGDRSAIGQYAFALTIVMSLNIILSTIQHIAAPYFSGMQTDLLRIKSTFHKYQRIMIPIVLIFPLLVYGCSNLFIPFIFLDKFNLALLVLPYLLFEWCFRGLATLKLISLWGAGFVKYSSGINAIHVLFSVGLFYLGVKEFGLWGVLFARILASFIKYVLVSTVYSMKIKGG